MKSETIKFHKGNGSNYRVTYNHDAQLTYLTRYYTNGHQNADDDTKVFLHIEVIKDWNDAEIKYNETLVSITENETEIKPINKVGAKARIKAIKEFQDFDDKYQMNAFAEGFTKAIKNCKTL